jgi:amino acid adenylation domain-containing protein
MPKGWQQIAAVLGTLMAGGAYLPIDMALPEARIAHLLKDGDIRSVLVISGEVPQAVHDRGCVALDVTALAPGRQEPIEPARSSQGDLAYVLYTSGSTGLPKGVMISHRSAVNLVADMNRRFSAGAQDRWFAISQLHFDLSVYDIFGALSAGGALVMPDTDRLTDARHWLYLATTAGVTIWNSVPAIVQLLIEEAMEAGLPLPPSLRLVMMSGDRIPVPLPGSVTALSPATRVVSLGGPTETTVWNICHPIDEVDQHWRNIPYGKPTANNRYHVLNAELAPCQDWVCGTLYAAGTGLAEGYWKDDARTDERFFEHPASGERLYDTGDEGRYHPDGTIEILGRSDFQIKLNGYRIEIGEIETLLVSHEAVDAATVVCQEVADNKHLVAFIVSTTAVVQTAALKSVLRTYLKERLPDYMVPRRIVFLDCLPLTGNGKVDRKALALHDTGPVVPVAQPSTLAPDDGIEARVTEIWRDLLRVPVVAPDISFFQLGGDSLTAAKLGSRLRKEFGISLRLAQLLRLETVRAMSSHIRSLQSKNTQPGDTLTSSR